MPNAIKNSVPNKSASVMYDVIFILYIQWLNSLYPMVKFNIEPLNSIAVYSDSIRISETLYDAHFYSTLVFVSPYSPNLLIL